MPSEKDDSSFATECWIVTIPSRGRLSLYGSDPDEIQIADIANALGHQCRFTGHMQPWAWYSVAEHSLDVATIVRFLGGSLYEQYVAQMHDSPEYGLADIAAPFKREIHGYKPKEGLIWERVADKFQLPLQLPEIIKTADWIALFMEAMTFVVPDNWELVEGWVGWKDYGVLARRYYDSWVPSRWNLFRRRQIMRGLNHRKAGDEFLVKFYERAPRRVRDQLKLVA